MPSSQDLKDLRQPSHATRCAERSGRVRDLLRDSFAPAPVLLPQQVVQFRRFWQFRGFGNFRITQLPNYPITNLLVTKRLTQSTPGDVSSRIPERSERVRDLLRGSFAPAPVLLPQQVVQFRRFWQFRGFGNFQITQLPNYPITNLLVTPFSAGKQLNFSFRGLGQKELQ
jgi:hypothetical protein